MFQEKTNAWGGRRVLCVGKWAKWYREWACLKLHTCAVQADSLMQNKHDMHITCKHSIVVPRHLPDAAARLVRAATTGKYAVTTLAETRH
jgi:hypothetical protein